MTEAAPGFDIERIVPDLLRTDDPLERDMLRLHVERYRFAARFVAGRRVLDCACGVGYGSAILKQAGATDVVGVDRDAEAIRFARERYAAPGIEFRQDDAMTFRIDLLVEVAVSLETIEHLPAARGFVRRLADLVAPGGIVVGSVPTTLSSDVNPYHLHDFSAGEFRRLFADCGLEVVDALDQVQPFSPFGVLRLRKTSHRDFGLRKGLLGYYAARPGMLARRLATTLVHGFRNKYLVLAGRKR